MRARLPTRPHPSGVGLAAHLGSRFWEDDLPHGLCVLAGLAEIVQQPMPRVASLLAW